MKSGLCAFGLYMSLSMTGRQVALELQERGKVVLRQNVREGEKVLLG